MHKLIKKADVLIEALPYIRTFKGKTVVIKYGGHAMTDAFSACPVDRASPTPRGLSTRQPA